MSAKHTPEPWHFAPHEDWSQYHGNIIGQRPQDGPRHIRTIACMLKHGSVEENNANAARIVDCVNACEGMGDPAAEIARYREYARECDEVLPAATQTIKNLKADLREALDALEAMCSHGADIDEYISARTVLRKHGRAV